MIKRWMRAAALLLLPALLLSGCAGFLDREFYVEEPHVPRQESSATDSDDEINNYYKLKNALLSVISLGIQNETFRLSQYSGDLEEDLTRISTELTEETPMGAYAVSGIVFERSPLLSYHQIKVSIQYRRTPEEIQAVQKVIGVMDYERQILQALEGGQENLAMEISFYADNLYDIDRVWKVYYENSAEALGLVNVEMETFPETGFQRILQLRFTFSEGREDLRN